MRAARYMGVDPWELAARPYSWTAYALDSENAEMAAQVFLEKARERRAKRRGGG